MDQFIEFLKEVNIIQIFIIFAGGWFFYNRLDNKLDKSINGLESKIDKLSEKVEDIDRRLCRIEGSLSNHGHCLFNQAKPEQKAQ
jgi:hypothetical protein